MSGNDKTQEQLATEAKEAKQKKFNENPDKFIDLDEIIIATKRSPKGIMYVVGKATRNEIMLSKAEIDHQIEKVLTILDMQKQYGKRIIVPKKSRGLFGGKLKGLG